MGRRIWYLKSDLEIFDLVDGGELSKKDSDY